MRKIEKRISVQASFFRSLALAYIWLFKNIEFANNFTNSKGKESIYF